MSFIHTNKRDCAKCESCGKEFWLCPKVWLRNCRPRCCKCGGLLYQREDLLGVGALRDDGKPLHLFYAAYHSMENDNAGWGAIVVDSRGVIQDTISDYATSVSQSRAEIMAVCQVLTLLAKNAKAIVVSQPNYLSDIHKYWRIRAMAKRRWHMDSGELVPDSDLLHNLLVLENARRISWQKIWRSEQRFYTQTQQLAATVFQTKGV